MYLFVQLKLVMEREASNALFEKQITGMRETLAAAEEESSRRKLWNGERLHVIGMIDSHLCLRKCVRVWFRGVNA